MHVEGCYGRHCLHPDCLLLFVGCSSHGMDLAMHVFDEFGGRLVVSVTAECIGLL